MTKEEFIEQYTTRSGVTKTDTGYTAGNGVEYVALPCYCGETCCGGWAMIRDDPENIQTHLMFSGRKPEAG